MEKCPVCIKGNLLTKLSSSGSETFCLSCRRIIKSATFNFEFKVGANADTAQDIQPCKTSDSRPGWKGPGKKAVCHPYTGGDEDSETKAKAKAVESAYAFQHKRSASKIVNALAYFEGAPSSLMPPSGATGQQAMPNPSPTMPQDFSATDQSPIGQATAPGGMQPGNLNGPNPLNSGTTASKRLAELISEELGPSFCTEHMSYDGCNHNQNSQ